MKWYHAISGGEPAAGSSFFREKPAAGRSLLQEEPAAGRNFLQLNLQLFAEDQGGEKTEKATSKKKEDARKKGNVLKSVELITAFVLLVAFFALRLCSGIIYEQITGFTVRLYQEFILAVDSMTINSLYRLFGDALITFLICTGPILAIVFVAALVSNVAQVGFNFTMEPLMFKPDKISPISGFKRMFSLKSVVKLIVSLLKVVVIGTMAYSFVNDHMRDLMLLMGADINLIVEKGVGMIFDLAFRVCAAMVILAFFEFMYQWWQHEKDLRMTKQEVKEEYKQMEGDPKIKSKIKEKQRQISMQRMMNDVPKADVVITNPTHFAVAVRYDQQESDAPIVTAKGQDYMAYRIKQVAMENGVEIVENKPLARALYDSVQVGGRIPVELYQAVAEVLAFVYNLKGTHRNAL